MRSQKATQLLANLFTRVTAKDWLQTVALKGLDRLK